MDLPSKVVAHRNIHHTSRAFAGRLFVRNRTDSARLAETAWKKTNSNKSLYE
jgi:hypothetical protein